MILNTLRFGGFELRHNPIKLNFQRKRRLSDYETSQKKVVQSVSEENCVIKGEGELVGSDCLEQYKALEKLYERREKGLLTLPGFEPFEAYFTALSGSADEKKNLVRYSFEFTKIGCKGTGVGKVYICVGDETLFDIAYDFGCDLLSLVKLNPHLRRADKLKEGERVILC